MLGGIRIVEFEGLGPAPFAGMMLADLGADVVVVHRAKGGAAGAGERSVLDRGKRSIVLDLKSEEGRDTALALIDWAEASIEGLRPGVMERLGLGPEDAHARNPALVYGRMTGWGQDGPRARQAGHDLNYIGTSGALHYASPPGQPPMTPATLVGDIGGGALYLVAGLLAGLLKAQRTGQGCIVDAAIVDGSAHMMALLMALAQGGKMREGRGQSLLDGPHWSRVYRCSDGGHISVQCLEPQFYAEFLDRLSLSDDPDFADQMDGAKWPRQSAMLAEIFAAAPMDYWAERFDGSDACVAPVLSPWQSQTDPHMAARAVWHSPDGVLQPAPAPRFDGAAAIIKPSPDRDQHRAEILTMLGR